MVDAAYDFGTFFRQRRRILGLTLREFCRRNGLDPGNISRIERGLSPPPKEGVEDLAKALGLQSGSSDWNMFVDLALAAATERIARKITGSAAMGGDSQLVPKNRSRPNQTSTWITASDIALWAERLDARAQFPRLLRRLIHRTVQQPARIDFPADESIDRSGPDGTIVTSIESQFTPSGRSIWELGVSNDPRDKAEKDFRKRTSGMANEDLKQVTFVFVTPRRWSRKQRWCEEKRAQCIWKDVRAYDADDLEQWLELNPIVDAWFARLVGKTTDGILDLEEYWNRLRGIAVPPLTPAVFLCSRRDDEKVIQDWLAGPPGPLAMESLSANDVVDFFAAYAVSREEPQRSQLIAKIAILDRREDWELLVTEDEPAILVPLPSLSIDYEMAGRAQRNGHHLLLASRHILSDGNKHVLSRPWPHELQSVLVKSGLKEREAEQSARDCGGSLTILKRLVTAFPSTKSPEWARGENSDVLASLALLGSWDENYTGDIKVIEKLTRLAYPEVQTVVCGVSQLDDPPIIQALGIWSFLSREDSWILLARRVSQSTIREFEKLAMRVLEEEDPALDLPAEQRHLASVLSKKAKFSPSLRIGMAETLAIITSLRLHTDTAWTGSEISQGIVRRVLDKHATWKRWASLNRILPLLAEAAPHEFLNAVQADLHNVAPQLAVLFCNQGDGLFSEQFYTGVLWALETLAWSSAYLRPASLALARLSEAIPDSPAHRADESLTEIFLPWLPKTSANIGDRLKVLQAIDNQSPAVGGKLFLSLLPASLGVSRPTAKPVWQQSWLPRDPQVVTHDEYWRLIGFCAERLVERDYQDVDLAVSAIKKLGGFPVIHRAMLMASLRRIVPEHLANEDRRKLIDALRDQIQWQTSRQSNDESLSADDQSALTETLRHFEPKDGVSQFAWLFSAYPRFAGDRRDRDQLLANERRNVLEQIGVAGGLPYVMDLARVAKAPHLVGQSLAQLTDRFDGDILPRLLSDPESSICAFAQGYAAEVFRSKHWDWAAQLGAPNWTAVQAVRFALALPPCKRLWDFVDLLGSEVVDLYWKQASVYGVSSEDAEENPGIVSWVAIRLLEHARFDSAAQFLTMAIHQKQALDPIVVFQVLEAIDGSADYTVNLSADVQELFKYLQQSAADTNKARLCRLEWKFLGMLDGPEAFPITLHKELASTPEFFLELLKCVYSPSHASTDQPAERANTELDERRAHNAYTLLNSWHSIPGYDPESGDYDDHTLFDWLRRARVLCKKNGFEEIGDQMIGQLLAHGTVADDKTLPCVSVRDAIEECQSEELENGFCIGMLNKRGAVWKSLSEGGKKEKELEAQFSQNAKLCEIEWPRTSAMLKRLADHYRSDAAREDGRTELRRLR